jgi:hypothetical protein
MSFQEDGYRTGFPKTCPLGRPGPITAMVCAGCTFRLIDDRLHWRCNHSDYQNAPGVHFCPGCHIELGPNAEANGWEYCGGPTMRCRYDPIFSIEVK